MLQPNLSSQHFAPSELMFLKHVKARRLTVAIANLPIRAVHGGESPSVLANPFRGKDKAAVLTKVCKDPLGNFLVVIPGTGDFQNCHIR